MKKFTRLFWQFWFEFRRKFFGKSAPFRTTYLSEVPEDLEKNRIYLVGEDNHFWFAVFLCPCGCGTIVQVSLLGNSNPHWIVTEHRNSTISLSPSVWRKDGCRSHYFVRNGLIEWV